MPSRVLVARIDAGEERPEERKGWRIPNLREYVRQNRPVLVRAALIILRAHFLAGSPKQAGLSAFGRFEEWNDQIRAALIWAGFADPLITREEVIDDDPEREQRAALLAAWNAALGTEALTLKAVIATANSDGVKGSDLNNNLKEALFDVAGDGKSGGISSNRLAGWCRKQLGRHTEGLVLAKAGQNTHTKHRCWAVKIAVGAVRCGTIFSPNAGETHNNDHHPDMDCHPYVNGLGNPPQSTAPTANLQNGSAPKDDVERF
jgi:hypothetical protein